jgi:hypothetical protein
MHFVNCYCIEKVLDCFFLNIHWNKRLLRVFCWKKKRILSKFKNFVKVISKIYDPSRMPSLEKHFYQTDVYQIKIVSDASLFQACAYVFWVLTRRAWWCWYNAIEHNYYPEMLAVCSENN